MELTQLVFQVDTSALKAAQVELTNLGKAVQDVAAKQVKADREVEKAAEKRAESSKKVVKATEEVVEETDKAAAFVERLSDTYKNLANGFTRGESGILNQAKALGLFGAELQPVIDLLGKIKGLTKDPFDSSLGSIRSVTAEFEALNLRASLAAQQIFLTTKQLSEYSKLKAEIEGKFTTQGVDVNSESGQQQVLARLKEEQSTYLEIANNVNNLKQEEKLRNKELADAQAAEAQRKRDIEAVNQAIDKQNQLMRSTMWRDWSSSVGIASIEMKALNSYYSDLERTSKESADALDKQNQLLRSSEWKSWASGVGIASTEMKQLNSYYTELERTSKEATATLEKQYQILRNSAWKEYANDVGKTTNEMKQLNAYFKQQEADALALDKQRFDAMAQKEQKVRAVISIEQQLLESEKKLAFQNEQLNRGFTVASANALYKYKEALEQAGLSVNETKQKMYQFEQALIKKQGTSPFAKMQKDVEHLDTTVNHLARNIGVQFTDIFVSLANGQSIFQVATQQGGQLADAFLQAGVEGKNMGNQLVAGATAILNSYKMLFSAFTDLGGRAIKGAGDAVAKFGSDITGLNWVLDKTKQKLASQGEEGFRMIGILTRVGAVASTAAGILVTSLVAALVALGVGFFQATKKQDEFTRALILSSNSFGQNLYSAIELAKGLDSVGVSASKAIEIMTVMAKEGYNVKTSLAGVITVAADLNKWLNVSIEDTVKKYQELGKEPVDNLLKLARSTGQVSIETLNLVDSLIKQGRQMEAIKIATDAAIAVDKNKVDQAKEQLSIFAQSIISIGASISNFFDKAFRSIWYASDPSKAMASKVSSVQAQLERARANDPGRVEEYEKQLAKLLDAEKAYNSKLLRSFDNEQMNKAAADAFALNKVLGDIEEKAFKKKLTETEFVNKKIEDLNKDLVSKNLDTVRKGTPEYARAVAAYAQEWKDSQSKAKTPDQKLDDYYQRVIDRASDALDSARGKQDNLTAAMKAYADVANDPNFAKLSSDQKERIKSIYLEADATLRAADAEKRREDQLDAIARLTGQADGLGREYYETLKIVGQAYDDGNISQEKYIELLKLMDKLTPSAKAFAQINQSIAESIASMNSEIEKLNIEKLTAFMTADQKKTYMIGVDYTSGMSKAEQQKSKRLLDAEKLNPSDKSKAIQLAEEEYNKSIEFLTKKRDYEEYILSDSYKRQAEYAKSFENLFSSMGDALADFALTGKADFKSMITSMLSDLVRLEMRMMMMNMYKSMGGMSGIIGSIGSLFGSSSASAPVVDSTASMMLSAFAAKGRAYSAGSEIEAFAKGGAFTNSVVSSPTLFKFAKGTGLMGEAGPEAIMPLKRGPDGSLGVVNNSRNTGGNVQVNIINNSNVEATTNETTDDRGNRNIEVIIGEMVAGEIRRTGSPVQKTMKTTFGSAPLLTRR